MEETISENNQLEEVSEPIKLEEEKTEELIESTHEIKEEINTEDSSLNYNVKIASSKLRELKSLDSINAFIKGDERVTVIKASERAKNALLQN